MVNGVDHQYGFQSEEETNDLGMNVIAYQWRDYDPAIARFNKIDRFAEKYNPVSPYTFTANNPLNYREIKGDSLKVANNDQTKEYLNSAAKKRNQDFIKYDDDDGNVTLDFGDLSEKKIARRLKNDSGLSAINDVVNATDSDGKSEKYYFEVGFEVREKIGDREFTSSTEDIAGKELTSTEFITNLSTTPRGGGVLGGTPSEGYDGAIFITPGKGFDFTKSYRPMGTGGLVTHELRESYLRTNQKKPYKEAHESAGGQSSYSVYRVDEKQ